MDKQNIQLGEIIDYVTAEVKKNIDAYFIDKFLSIELMVKEKLIAEHFQNVPMVMDIGEK